MGKTLYDKIWDAHLVEEPKGELPILYIDRHLIHEVTSPQAFEGLRNTGRTVRRPELTLAVAPDVPKGVRGDATRLRQWALALALGVLGFALFAVLLRAQGEAEGDQARPDREERAADDQQRGGHGVDQQADLIVRLDLHVLPTRRAERGQPGVAEGPVPGLLEEKITALLRTVPQKHRHRLQPMAESAEAFMAWYAEQPAGPRYELLDGHIHEMQAEQLAHAEIKARVLVAFRRGIATRDLPCQGLGDGMAVRVDGDWNAALASAEPGVPVAGLGSAGISGMGCPVCGFTGPLSLLMTTPPAPRRR